MAVKQLRLLSDEERWIKKGKNELKRLFLSLKD